MCRLVAAAQLDTPEDLAAFIRWRDTDGTKVGLLKLAYAQAMHHALAVLGSSPVGVIAAAHLGITAALIAWARAIHEKQGHG
jgi:hypothetical protein